MFDVMQEAGLLLDFDQKSVRSLNADQMFAFFMKRESHIHVEVLKYLDQIAGLHQVIDGYRPRKKALMLALQAANGEPRRLDDGAVLARAKSYLAFMRGDQPSDD